MSKISIIIPIFNAEKYLLRTIQCLKTQTFIDFEVLLIDDGSKDNTAQLLQEATEGDSRFRYIYQENQGVSAARNHGLRLCTGPYVTFLDADDIFPANYLECLLKALVQNDCQLAVCDVVVLEGETEAKRFTCASKLLTQKQALDLLLSRQQINSGPYAKLFRRELLEGINFPPLRAYEDILFVMDAVCKCEKIATTAETEYGYIQNEGSAMSHFMKIPSKDIVTATEQMLAFLKNRKDLTPLCFYTTASHLMQYVIPLVKCKDKNAHVFVNAAQGVYKKYISGIWSCSAFPWKEKITYTLFALGWMYQDKKIIRVR